MLGRLPRHLAFGKVSGTCRLLLLSFHWKSAGILTTSTAAGKTAHCVLGSSTLRARSGQDIGVGFWVKRRPPLALVPCCFSPFSGHPSSSGSRVCGAAPFGPQHWGDGRLNPLPQQGPLVSNNHGPTSSQTSCWTLWPADASQALWTGLELRGTRGPLPQASFLLFHSVPYS